MEDVAVVGVLLRVEPRRLMDRFVVGRVGRRRSKCQYLKFPKAFIEIILVLFVVSFFAYSLSVRNPDEYVRPICAARILAEEHLFRIVDRRAMPVELLVGHVVEIDSSQPEVILPVFLRYGLEGGQIASTFVKLEVDRFIASVFQADQRVRIVLTSL
jgi:hypothetical protein